MLGCEYGCKDAVEVLLRNGADAALTDGLGHDCAYYARIGDNIDILALIKAAVEDSSRGRREPTAPSFEWRCVPTPVCPGAVLEGSCGHTLPVWEGKELLGLCGSSKAFKGVAGSDASSEGLTILIMGVIYPYL